MAYTWWYLVCAGQHKKIYEYQVAWNVSLYVKLEEREG